VGVIIDSSVVIAAERLNDTVWTFLDRVARAVGDQDAALSSVGLTELVHGIYRARTTAARVRREQFLRELLTNLAVYPYTTETAMIAGRIDGEQQELGVTIPFSDLLIGATAISIDFSVVTFNLRHFRLIPGLSVISM
jgi:tRNA(fMet)-specific endonuclease VapC